MITMNFVALTRRHPAPWVVRQNEDGSATLLNANKEVIVHTGSPKGKHLIDLDCRELQIMAALVNEKENS